ncbi:HD domain-containing protein [bacterium]|nr:HD domain-containing protein [bacterium]
MLITDVSYNSSFLEQAKQYPLLFDFFLELAKEAKYSAQLFKLNNALSCILDENNDVSEENKTRLMNFIDTGVSLMYFSDVYKEYCKYDSENHVKKFDDEGYSKVLNLISETSLAMKSTHHYQLKNIAKILNGTFDISKLNFQNKVALLSVLKDMKDTKYSKLFASAISEIETSIYTDNVAIPVSEEIRVDFIRNVLASKIDRLSEFETVIANSSSEFEKMNDGLPLKYSRKEFLKDLSAICPSDLFSQLEKKLDVQFVLSPANDEIIGYDGILNTSNLDLNNPLEKEISDKINKFLFENEVATNNEELNKNLDFVIKALPEFINIIGKKQHATHKYTLDIHSLLVLSYSLNNPDYLAKLNQKDRTLLKFAAILHDITKKESEIDPAHPELSSMYARSISSKFFKSSELAERFSNLINNHHWTKAYNVPNKARIAQELAFKFRRPNDFEIAQIMARSDLMAVNENFANKYLSCLESANLKPIYDNLDFLHQSGNAVFVDRVFLPEKLNNHIQRYNNRDYKVINLHELPDDFDMYEFGFKYGTKKKDLRFLVHMFDTGTLKSQLATFKMLSKESNGGVLSESIISPDCKNTYYDRKFGVFLSQSNSNIINIGKNNQGSGTKKNIDNAIGLAFSTDSSDRKQYRTKLLKQLKIDPNSITDSEYADFYRNNIVYLSSVSEIPSSRFYKIGKYTIKGEVLKNALRSCQDELLDKATKRHNEIIGFAPKIRGVIAKAKSLNELPSDLLDFAYKNDMPVVLI